MSTQDLNTLTQKAPAKKEFLGYIHNFRGLAIIFVVAAHINVIWPEDSAMHRFFQTLWENSTILFMFMAGYLFQYLSRKFEYKSYFAKKMEYVILPYLILSIPIIVYRVITLDTPELTMQLYPDFKSWSVLHKVVFYIFRGAHMQQYWFIPMIFIYYVAAPLLLYIDKHPKLYWILIPAIIASYIFGREPLINIPKMFVHFFSVYLFGMFMSRYRKEYLEFAKKYWVIITVVTLAAFTINYVYYPHYNGPLNYTHKMLFCAFFIYWLWKLERFIPKFFSVLADISFGLYFVHYYVIIVLRAIYVKIFKHPVDGNLLTWFINFVAVMFVSYLIIMAARKMFGKNSKRLVGC